NVTDFSLKISPDFSIEKYISSIDSLNAISSSPLLCLKHHISPKGTLAGGHGKQEYNSNSREFAFCMLVLTLEK
ncbi:hypothetical protein Q6333_29785, partial [Klebsiella pneumoniae]